MIISVTTTFIARRYEIDIDVVVFMSVTIEGKVQEYKVFNEEYKDNKMKIDR